MENFNIIPNAGTYGSAIALINANFSLTKEQLERLSYSREGFCGMYDTPISLGEAYPNPTTGSFAYVGTSFPMDVYTATNGVWAKTIEDGYSGGGIDLTQYADKASLTALAGRVTALENAGYVFIGIATPAGAPSPSQAKRFALAWAAGTYTYYGGFVLNSGEMAVLMYNGSAWSGAKTDIIAKGVVGGYDTTPTEDSEKPITSGGVYTAMDELRSDMEDELSNVDMEFGSGEYVSDVIIHNSVGQNESVLLTQGGITSFVFNEIDINDIDNLNNVDYAYSPSQSQSKKTSYYTVVTFRGASTTQKVKIGTMAVISDGLANTVTEVMTTRYILDASGNLTGEFSNNDVFTIYRSTSGNTWTQWHYVNESVWGNAINTIRTDLTNYYTKSQTYSRTEVDNLIAAINQFEYIVVNSLPYPPSANTMRKIYLIPSAHSVTQNVKDEYITIQDGNSYKWEQIGSTAVDLSGYSTTTEMNTAINAAIASALISYYTKTQVDTLLGEKQDVIDDLSTIRSGAAAGATAVQPADIADFATTDYVGEAIEDAIDAIPVDEEPTAGSENLMKSGGVYKEIGYDFTMEGRLNNHGYIVDISDTNKNTTEYIPAYHGHYRIRANTYSGQVCIAFYDYAKHPISVITGTSEDWESTTFEGDVPSGTYYMRVTSRKPYEGTYVLVRAEQHHQFITKGDSESFTLVGYFDSDDRLVPASNWRATDYIEVADGSNYSLYLKGEENATTNVLFYDKSKILISSLGQGGWYQYTGVLPSGTCYVRMSSHIGNSGQYTEYIRFGFEVDSLLNHIANISGTNELVNGDSDAFSEYGYFDANGAIHATSTSSSWAATPFIPIPAGAKYEAYLMGQAPITANILFYNIDQDLLEVVMATKDQEYEYLRGTAPIDALYVRMSSYIGRDQSLDDEWFRFSAGSIMPTVEQLIKGHSVATSLMYGDNFMGKPFSFNGKTAAFFGDSVTLGIKSPRPITQANKCYREWLCERLGLTGTNYAVSGSLICDLEDKNSSILNKVLNTVTASFETDYIFIAGGINDFWKGSPLGVITDDTYETFYGALNVMCSHLNTVLSGKDTQVIFLTPINCTRDDLSGSIAPLDEYRSAIFRVATMNGYNVVDTSKIGFPTDINDAAYRQATIADGVHPTEYGHKMMGLNLAAILV